MSQNHACSRGVNGSGIVVILGTTGVGKSKLGIELAKRLNGEVINADVMQMYKGLSIATAKVTDDEMEGIKHHLMSFLEPTDNFTPHEFRRLADAKIAEINARGRLPIIVGGTMYYVQGLLWDHLMDTSNVSKSFSCESSRADKISNVSETSDVSWEELNSVDPEMAKQIHPNNIRKIKQSLSIFRSCGTRHSELIRMQHAQGGGLGAGQNRLRYTNCGLIWLKADREVLRDRLDARVDRMMRDGLQREIAELQSNMLKLNKSSNDDRVPYDASRGVFQSIGFKEFEEYLALLRSSNKQHHLDTAAAAAGGGGGAAAVEDETVKQQLESALEAGVEQLKVSTKRYARRQMAWIRNRIVGHIPVCMLDATNLDNFQSDVVEKAELAMKHILGLNFNSEGDIGIQDLKAKAETIAMNAQKAAQLFVDDYNVKTRQAELKSEQRRKRRKLEAEKRHERNMKAIAMKNERLSQGDTSHNFS